MSQSNLVDLNEARPRQDVVELLEEMLQLARAGRIRAVAVVSHLEGRGTGSAYCLGDGNVAHLVTGIERVKLRLLDE